MHTFSCALQTVDVLGVSVSFEADPQDYHVCRLVIEGHAVVTFNRNGLVASVEAADPTPPAQSEAEADATPPEPDLTSDPDQQSPEG